MAEEKKKLTKKQKAERALRNKIQRYKDKAITRSDSWRLDVGLLMGYRGKAVSIVNIVTRNLEGYKGAFSRQYTLEWLMYYVENRYEVRKDLRELVKTLGDSVQF